MKEFKPLFNEEERKAEIGRGQLIKINYYFIWFSVFVLFLFWKTGKQLRKEQNHVGVPWHFTGRLGRWGFNVLLEINLLNAHQVIKGKNKIR